MTRGQNPESRLLGELKQTKRELAATRTALEQREAALASTRDDVFRLVARGRLRDVDVVWTSGVAMRVIGLDGRIDVALLEQLVGDLSQADRGEGGTSVGAAA